MLSGRRVKGDAFGVCRSEFSEVNSWTNWVLRARSKGQIQMRKPIRLMVLVAAVLGSLAAMSQPEIVSAACAAEGNTCGGYLYDFAPTGNTTGSCPSGRTCYTPATQSSCAANCRHYNAGGTSISFAARNTTSSLDGFANGGTMSGNANRMYNNNSGSLRPVCAWKLYGMGGSFSSNTLTIDYYGSGWNIIPFTGVGTHAAIPSTWVCE